MILIVIFLILYIRQQIFTFPYSCKNKAYLRKKKYKIINMSLNNENHIRERIHKFLHAYITALQIMAYTINKINLLPKYYMYGNFLLCINRIY